MWTTNYPIFFRTGWFLGVWLFLATTGPAALCYAEAITVSPGSSIQAAIDLKALDEVDTGTPCSGKYVVQSRITIP